MTRIERYSKLLENIDFDDGVVIDDRTYYGPKEAIEEIRELEELYQALKGIDILSLYEKTVAHDGMHDEDIADHGRYYAYLRFELKGQSAEEKEENLLKALAPLAEKFGRDKLIKYFPGTIKGRQVTEDLKIRPEDEDYPSYYSDFRRSYAEKMAKEEVPHVVLSGIREEQEKILNRYDWNTLYVADTGGKLIEVCGDMYLVPGDSYEKVALYAELWNSLVDKGEESFYEFSIATDGEYPRDENNPYGRYYAYVKLELKGLSEEGRSKFLSENLPENVVKGLGMEEIVSIFPSRIDGDLVTQPLTIRPDEEEFESHFNPRKVEQGKKRAYKQVLFNIRAEIIDRLSKLLGEVKKAIILEESTE